MSTPTTPPPEFSRPVEWQAAGKARIALSIAAGPEERAALAKRFGLVGLDSLSADLVIHVAGEGQRLRLTGRLRATLAQQCVVTLEPVPAQVDEEFSVVYAAADEGGDEFVLGAEGDDSWDEPWPGPILDVGEAVAQQLALAMDPYPRAPGAKLSEPADPDDGPRRPFAGLSAGPRRKRGRA